MGCGRISQHQWANTIYIGSGITQKWANKKSGQNKLRAKQIKEEAAPKVKTDYQTDGFYFWDSFFLHASRQTKYEDNFIVRQALTVQ
jgi:hypothetical protein